MPFTCHCYILDNPTEYIDALGSSQTGERDGERETAGRSSDNSGHTVVRSGLVGRAAVVAEGITWAAARCTRARRLRRLVAFERALLLRLQNANPPLVPACVHVAWTCCMCMLYIYMHTGSEPAQPPLVSACAHVYACGAHAARMPCTCRAGMPRARAGVRTGARAWGQARTQARAGAAWGLRPGLRLRLALWLGLGLGLGLGVRAGRTRRTGTAILKLY